MVPGPFLLNHALRANHDHGFIYLNNPKVGSSTIKTNLWTAIRGAPPARGDMLHRLEGSPFVNTLSADARDAYVFTFVRNPFVRLVSAYLNKVERRRDQVWPGFAQRNGLDPKAAISFDGFVEVIASVPPERNDPHWRAQHINVLGSLVTPNLVGDLLDLDALLPEVMEAIFGTAPARVAQHRAHETEAAQSWRGFYGDAGTVARVRQVYAGDFATYGYGDDPAGDAASRSLPLRSTAPHDGLAGCARG